MNETTEQEYNISLDEIMSRFAYLKYSGIDMDIQIHKYIGDKLANTWVEGLTQDEWIDRAGIKEYEEGE